MKNSSPRPLALALASGLALAFALPAQGDQEALIEKRNNKLQEEFLKNGSWITDYDKARAEAKKTGKVIFGYFTRSYSHWPPCKMLESGALSEEGFKEFGDKVVLFCHITSRVKDDPYQELLTEKGGTGFPYLAYMDADGNVIAKPEGRSISAFEAGLSEDVPAYYELEKKAAAGDKEAKAEFFMQRFQLGHFKAEELKKAMQEKDFLSEDQIETVDLALREIEVNEILKNAKITRGDPKSYGPTAKAFLKMKQAGRLPEGRAALNPYIIMMEWAYVEKNAKLFEECYNGLKEIPGVRFRAQFTEEQEKRLEKLKAEAVKEEGEEKGEEKGEKKGEGKGEKKVEQPSSRPS